MMTDWCLSELTFCAPEEQIAHLLERLGCGDFNGYYSSIASRFFPLPQELVLGLETDVDAWRTWAWSNWGCKYGDSSMKLLLRLPGKVVFVQKTDWNPPLEALRRLTALPEYRQLIITIAYQLQADFCDPFELTGVDGRYAIRDGAVFDRLPGQ